MEENRQIKLLKDHEMEREAWKVKKMEL